MPPKDLQLDEDSYGSSTATASTTASYPKQRPLVLTKQVRFDCDPVVHCVENIHNNTPEQQQLFYSADEYTFIAMRDQLLVELTIQGIPSDEEHSLRGLERHLNRTHQQQQQHDYSYRNNEEEEEEEENPTTAATDAVLQAQHWGLLTATGPQGGLPAQYRTQVEQDVSAALEQAARDASEQRHERRKEEKCLRRRRRRQEQFMSRQEEHFPSWRMEL